MTESLKENEPEASGLQNRLPSFSLNMLLRNVSITLLINHKIVITFCQELFTPTIKLPNDYWQKNIFWWQKNDASYQNLFLLYVDNPYFSTKKNTAALQSEGKLCSDQNSKRKIQTQKAIA